MGVLRLNQLDFGHKRLVTQKICLWSGIVIAVLSLLFGFLVTYFVMKEKENIHVGLSTDFIRSHLINGVSAEAISQYLSKLTSQPQLAGTAMDKTNAEYVQNEWKSHGIDAQLVPYTVLLSYRNGTNQVRRLGQSPYTSNAYEDPLTATDSERPYYASNPPFLAYATNGTVNGSLVYVNYGRVEDYDALRNIGINVSDRIVIARFGAIFRGNILENAQLNGASGLIIYSDPSDYTNGSTTWVYPNSVFLPGTGAQRGTTWIEDGDPLTPFYPSIDSAYRVLESDTRLPTIPAHCIGYNDARYLLAGLDGEPATEVFSNFKTGFNVTINVGPGYENEDTIELEVSNYRANRTIYNVIGVIKGCVEPDRYVLVGNHRDSWTFGAVDPSSGTASLLALTASLSDTRVHYNWCPRRSIVFCSWSAEEYGLIGSTEWVEDNQKTLLTQAVAYINVDNISGNYTLTARTTPLLYSSVWDAAQHVPNPDDQEVNNRPTVYDTWITRQFATINGTVMPAMLPPGGGSDHVPFLQIAGVPVLDFRYRCPLNEMCNPNYHTMYETYNLVANLMDRGFKFHRAVAQVWIELIRSLADTPLLPMSVGYYPVLLNEAVDHLLQYNNGSYSKIFAEQNITLDYLRASIADFSAAVNTFTRELANIDTNDDLKVRQANDRLMLLERAFLDGQGLPLRPQHHHVLLAPSSLNSYAGESFPGVYDLMWQYTDAVSRGWTNATEIIEQVKQHLSVVTFHIDAAAQFVGQRLY